MRFIFSVVLITDYFSIVVMFNFCICSSSRGARISSASKYFKAVQKTRRCASM